MRCSYHGWVLPVGEEPRPQDETALPTGETLLPQGENKVRMVREMFDTIAPRYDLVNRIMTFRLDTRWRKRTVRELGLAPGSRILDLAAGTGDLCRELQSAGHRPVGLDL